MSGVCFALIGIFYPPLFCILIVGVLSVVLSWCDDDRTD
jgi:hypothetical protein